MSTLWISETDTSTSYSSSLSTSTLTSVSGQPSLSMLSGSSARSAQGSTGASKPSSSVSFWLRFCAQLQLSTSLFTPSPSASSVAVTAGLFSAWLLSVLGSGRAGAGGGVTVVGRV